ncbi:MAG TPA: L-rhamnose/proton symporter RhaT [Bryobacteraceae bacterium]|nr:L-rhamnose/proton symporter RhaT [Bryobacteraceae bacterium]
MTNAAFWGVLLTLFAGGLGGTVLLPMKYTRGWRFENTWLLYSLCAYLISPWVVAFATIPGLSSVYAAAGLRACLLTGLFGFGWGLAVVLNGVGVAMVGLSLASAILMGSSVALGSLAPLLMKSPERLLTPAGLQILGLDLLMLAGVLLCALAGHLRGKAQSAKAEVRAITTRGILICSLAGVLSTLFNVALSYGEIISHQAEILGADPFYAANAVWSLAVSLGSLPSIVWCLWKLTRERQWSLFRAGLPARNAALCVSMGILWISGTVLYGSAAGMMGSLGTVIGWPIYMSAIILSSNFWGWLTGEWRGVSGAPVRVMLGGIVVQIAGIVLLGRIQ